MTVSIFLFIARLAPAAVIFALAATAGAQTPARQLFGAKWDAAKLPAAVYGTYHRGCVAGAEKLEDEGPTWQAMRLSRNRHWAHPELIETVKKLSRDGKSVGWNGLLVGDLTQPRGGPMISGHASHQAGLDADVWLTPMPDRLLTTEERESVSATSMLAKTEDDQLTHQEIDKELFTEAHANIIRIAAQYENVERIFVHPTIKRELCRQNPKKPKWLGKVRAQFGHHYHFHIRLGCPKGSRSCKPQAPIPSYGCDQATMDYWFKVAYAPKQTANPKRHSAEKPSKPNKKRNIRINQLPKQCINVLTSAGTMGSEPVSLASAAFLPAGPIPTPSWRPGSIDEELTGYAATADIPLTRSNISKSAGRTVSVRPW